MGQAMGGRAEADEGDGFLQAAIKSAGRFDRQIAGEDGGLAYAVKGLVADLFAYFWHAGDAGQFLALVAHAGFFCGPHGGDGGDGDLRACELRAGGGGVHELAENAFETIVGRMVQQVCLGGGKKNTLHALAENARGEAIGTLAEGGQHIGKRVR